MKKAVAIIGSPRDASSITYKITKCLFEEIVNIYDGFEYKILMLSNFEINTCKGCAGCFLNCQTCNQYEDDIGYLENEILQADIVLFGSPVYAHNITGIMKTFIDRISYWLHILRLTGKYGITVSVSNSNGTMFVDDYLSKIMEFLGVSVIDKLLYSNTNPLDIEIIRKAANKVVYYLEHDTEILNLEFKEKVFTIYKDAYSNEYKKILNSNEKAISAEAVYWNDHNYLKCNSFQELFALINK